MIYKPPRKVLFVLEDYVDKSVCTLDTRNLDESVLDFVKRSTQPDYDKRRDFWIAVVRDTWCHESAYLKVIPAITILMAHRFTYEIHRMRYFKGIRNFSERASELDPPNPIVYLRAQALGMSPDEYYKK